MNCKGCGAEIIWANAASGKPIPLDAKPEKRFVLKVERNEVFATMTETYVSHFATCPDADKFRQRAV